MYEIENLIKLKEKKVDGTFPSQYLLAETYLLYFYIE